MNPHAAQPASLLALIKSLWRNRQLIRQMTKRDVIGRYKDSVMGMAWSFFNPIFMLLVYTFVFSEVFKSRWGDIADSDSRTQFAIVLFVGMIILSLFSEAVNRAPRVIVSNVNYVKKVIFPLEILPVIAMGAALFHSMISLFVLAVAIFRAPRFTLKISRCFDQRHIGILIPMHQGKKLPTFQWFLS
ncbi:MAG: hypothetical protein FJ190_11750 [Gammaproteobacteria bacterium]|nr:hypothetical protein [Gammaproteobacteria bacterium]